MMKIRFLLHLVVAAVLFFYASTDQAYAYLDPGTGSILLQGLIGGIAGGLVVIRLYWGKIKGFFGGNVPSEGTDKSESSGSSDAG